MHREKIIQLVGLGGKMEFFRERIEEAIKKDIRYLKKKGYYDSKDNRTFETHLLGDLWDAVWKIDNKKDAVKFYNGYVEWLKSLPKEMKSKEFNEEQTARKMIGWLFGEGMKPERIAMWNKAVGARHPVFGSGTPLPKDPFKEGIKLGRSKK